MRIGATYVIVLFVTCACDRGRGREIAGDPAAHSTSADAAPSADADAVADADAATEADAEALPLIEIVPNTAPPTTVTISVSSGNREELARGLRGPLGTCYSAALSRDPMLAGTAVVRFVAEPDGKVDAPAAGGKTVFDAGLLDCIVGVLRRLSFGPPPMLPHVIQLQLAFRPY